MKSLSSVLRMLAVIAALGSVSRGVSTTLPYFYEFYLLDWWQPLENCLTRVPKSSTPTTSQIGACMSLCPLPSSQCTKIITSYLINPPPAVNVVTE